MGKRKGSIFNQYNYELQNDEAMLWLKANDEHYSNEFKDKGLEYPYLTKRKELYRQNKETAISNLSYSDFSKCKKTLDIKYDN